MQFTILPQSDFIKLCNVIVCRHTAGTGTHPSSGGEGGGHFEVNNYIVRSYRNVIVVINILTRRTNKA